MSKILAQELRRAGKARYDLLLPLDLKRALGHAAVERNLPVNVLVIEAVRLFLGLPEETAEKEEVRGEHSETKG